MASKLTPEEEAELAALEKEASRGSLGDDLSPEEEAELAALENDEDPLADVPLPIDNRGSPIPGAETPGEYEPSMATRALKFVDSIPVVGPGLRQMGEDFYADVAGYRKDGVLDSREVHAQSEEQLAEYNKKRPIESMAVGVAGGIPTALIPGSMPVQIATGMGIQAADSAVRGKSAEEVGDDVLLSGAVDTALGLTGKAVKGAYNVAKGVGRRTIMGVPDRIAERYKLRRKEVNAIDPKESIARAEEFQRGLKDKVSTAKNTERDAFETKRLYDQQTKSDLSKASPELEVIREITGDMKNARGEISELSNNVFDVLSEQGREFEKAPLRESLLGQMDKLRIAGEIDPKDAAPFDHYLNRVLRDIPEPSEKEIVKLSNKMSKGEENFTKRELDIIALHSGEVSNSLSAKDMKSLLMKIDNDTSHIFDKFKSGEHPTLGERQLLKFSKELREQLNEIPEYAEAMSPLRDKTKALNDLMDLVSADDVSVDRFLKNLNKPEREGSKVALDLFGLEQGKDYLGKLNDYNKLKYIRNNPLELDAYLKKQPQASMLNDARKSMSVAEEGLSSAGGKFDVRNAMRTGHLDGFDDKAATSKLQQLGSSMGRNLTEEAKDIGVQNFFNKELGNSGSRMVTTLGNMGAAVGGFLGAPKVGRAAGGFVGAALDVDRRRVYKALSDLKARGAPQFAIQAIEALAEKSPRAAMLEVNRLRGSDTEE